MPENPLLRIRWPDRKELPKLVNIYNQAIRSGGATGHTIEFNPKERREWYRSHDIFNYPIYVMELGRKIIGYGTLSPYREGRQAMRKIAEVSLFMDDAHQGKGYGSILLGYMIEDCRRVKINTLIAILLDVNKNSIHLLEKHGFQEWGHLKDIIEFNDKICGQLIYGLKIDEKVV